MPFGPAVHAPPDTSAAQWIAPELGDFGTVGGLVPHGDERYLLLDYRGAEPLGWSGVCGLFGRLVPILAAHTSTPDDCWLALREGYGENRRVLERERQRLREDDLRRNQATRSGLNRLPSFDLPNRRYYLVGGAVTAASEIERPDGRSPQPPDLWWPEDRNWFVSGDTDLEWCYIGGSHELVSAVGAECASQTRPVARSALNAVAGTRS